MVRIILNNNNLLIYQGSIKPKQKMQYGQYKNKTNLLHELVRYSDPHCNVFCLKQFLHFENNAGKQCLVKNITLHLLCNGCHCLFAYSVRDKN